MSASAHQCLGWLALRCGKNHQKQMQSDPMPRAYIRPTGLATHLLRSRRVPLALSSASDPRMRAVAFTNSTRIPTRDTNL